jgi:hypothetical protein
MSARTPKDLEGFKPLLPPDYFFEIVRVSGKNGVSRACGALTEPPVFALEHVRLVYEHKPGQVRLESPFMSLPLGEDTLRRMLTVMIEEQHKHLREFEDRTLYSCVVDLVAALKGSSVRELDARLARSDRFPMRLVLCTPSRKEIPANATPPGLLVSEVAALKVWCADKEEPASHAFSKTLKFPFTHRQWMDTLNSLQRDMQKAVDAS